MKQKKMSIKERYQPKKVIKHLEEKPVMSEESPEICPKCNNPLPIDGKCSVCN